MWAVRTINLLFFLLLLNGCGLIPKKVEYGQDKVKKVPAITATHKETQKQAADFVAKKTKQTVQAAFDEESSTNVLKPAIEAEVVADGLSDSLGKPKQEWKRSYKDLVDKLAKMDAKLDQRLEEFREENDKNVGKKVEGTGIFQISYFGNLLLIGGFLCFIWFGLKVISLFNPAVSVGTKVISGGIFGVSKAVKKIAEETIKGGERFQQEITRHIEDKATQEKVRELFKTCHQIEQSSDTQKFVKDLTN